MGMRELLEEEAAFWRAVCKPPTDPRVIESMRRRNERYCKYREMRKREPVMG